MDSITRGTTPTFKYTFEHVTISDITAAYLTIKSPGKTDLEKDITQAETGTNFLAWTLTQEETLNFADTISVMANYLTVNGLRGASEETDYVIKHNHKEVVI